MDETLWREFNRRLDEQYDHVVMRLDELSERLELLQTQTAARLDAHEDYHRRYEHRWGLMRLAERYPFRLALGAALLTLLLAPGLDDRILNILPRFFHFLLR